MYVATARVRLPVTDRQLERIGRENPGWKVELIDGAITMTPTTIETGRQNARLTAFLVAWADANGFVAFDSNAGFKVSKKTVLSPDGALIPLERWNELSESERAEYGRMVPEIVVELASKSDSVETARKKCANWFDRGAQYTVLLDPKNAGAESWGEAPPNFPSPEELLRCVMKV